MDEGMMEYSERGWSVKGEVVGDVVGEELGSVKGEVGGDVVGEELDSVKGDVGGDVGGEEGVVKIIGAVLFRMDALRRGFLRFLTCVLVVFGGGIKCSFVIE